MYKQVGFFIEQVIEPQLGSKEVHYECYSRDVTSFLHTVPYDTDPFESRLLQLYNLAARYNSITNSFIKNIVMYKLKRELLTYLEAISNIADDNNSPLYTVDRYDRVVMIELIEPMVFTVKSDGQIFVDFRYILNRNEYVLLSVELRRIFNSYSLANSYSCWHIQRRDNAFIDVLRDDSVAIGLLNSSNFNVLIDFDSKVKTCELSPLWDEYLTQSEDVKRFLEEATENIPIILDRNKSRQDESIYYQGVGRALLSNIKSI